MPGSYLRASALAALFALVLAVPATAQPIHPINMVSGVDSLSSTAWRTFFTVPQGQTLVLTDVSVAPTNSSRVRIFDGATLRYWLTPHTASSDWHHRMSLQTGLVFDAGHDLSILALNNTLVGCISWSGYLVPEVVGVAPTESENRIGFALTPNPSGQVVELRFELKTASEVSLRIYDVQGRLVTTLADARMPAGRHDFSWTGKNSQGKSVGSGVYFARLESSEANSVKRLVRVR